MTHLRSTLTMIAALGPMLLAGCSPWVPERVELMVGTLPPAASCIVSRGGQPIARAEPTPAIAIVDPAPGEMTVSCRRNGFNDVAVTVPPAQISGGPYIFTSPSLAESERRIEIALVPR